MGGFEGRHKACPYIGVLRGAEGRQAMDAAVGIVKLGVGSSGQWQEKARAAQRAFVAEIRCAARV